jgi:hypothetical protein
MSLPATRHSMVEALRSGDAETRRDGYGAMVAVYWKPLYKYVRLKWHMPVEAAQDATQAFVARACASIGSSPTNGNRRNG